MTLICGVSTTKTTPQIITAVECRWPSSRAAIALVLDINTLCLFLYIYIYISMLDVIIAHPYLLGCFSKRIFVCEGVTVADITDTVYDCAQLREFVRCAL